MALCSYCWRLTIHYVIADSDGALVLIVPPGSPDADPTKWTAHRRSNRGWRSLSVEQMRKLLRVDPDQQQPSPGDGSQSTEEASHTPRALTEALAAAKLLADN